MPKNYDFSGWATRNNIRCSDGRTILQDAFKDNDGQRVPLVWSHGHNEPTNVLGHAILENRADGVYAYCYFNNTPAATHSKEMVKHGDIRSLSIYANKLSQNAGRVQHGQIREVSLVLAGANPGAYIDTVIRHGEECEDEALICPWMQPELSHAETKVVKIEKDDDSDDENVVDDTTDDSEDKDDDDMSDDSENKDEEKSKSKTLEHEEKSMAKKDSDKTIKDVFDSMTEEQKNVVYYMVGSAIKKDKKGDSMKQNAFSQDTEHENDTFLSHEEETQFFDEFKVKKGSLKDLALQHDIENVGYLFPDAKNVTDTPTFIQRDMSWVQKVMAGVHKTPFSRIRSLFADITEDDARAKGYIKGNMKKEEVFTLLKRETIPTTIYKKQKMHRDDVVDITDFDVVAWLKAEMRMMLDEEIARAILIGDGRLSSAEDKIDATHLRPIWTDDSLYTINVPVDITASTTDDEKVQAFIRAVLKSRKNYKGSGNPTLYINQDMLADCLLLQDKQGRDIFTSVDQLATKLRVKEIIDIEVLNNQTRAVDTKTHTLLGIIVNLSDYNIGADKGGAVNMFDDFDIDYNAQKYLIETRISGALIKPYSAMAIESVMTTAEPPAAG